MSYFDDSHFEPVNRFVADLERYRTSAAEALKKFELAYNEVMGFDSNDNVPTNTLSFENLSTNISSSISLDSESNNDAADEVNLNYSEPSHRDSPLTSYFTNYRPNMCFYCHRYMTPPKPKMYIPTYRTKNEKRHCKNCLQTKHEHVISDHSVTEHPTSPVKQKNAEEQENSVTDVHKCPFKITVPEPFQMTIRDEGQKPIKELQMKQLKEKLDKETEKELCVHIYSNPVPAHVYVPLYKKMTDLSNNRKKLRRKKSADRMKEIVKPFNFSTGRKNMLRKSDSMPNLPPKESDYVFKANPVPKHILRSDVSEQLKYKEKARQLRITKRAQEMLKQSSLPFSTHRAINKSASSTNLKENDDKNRQRTFKKFHHKEVGDLSREECQTVMRDWNAKVTKLTCTRQHAREKVENGERQTFDTRYKNFLEAKTSTLFDGSVRTTTTFMLREREIRKELHARNKSETVESERTKWKKELRDRLQTKLHGATITDLEKDIEEKLQNYRESRRMRQIEYEQELMDIQKRIEKQPLLIERQSKVTKKDKSTNTDPKDFVNHSKVGSNRTSSSASSLASHNDTKSNSHSSLSEDSNHSS